MPIRSFGPQTLTTATPQPVFGTKLTAAVTPIPDQYTGSFAPGGNLPALTLAITAINGQTPFVGGDPVLVGPAAGPYEPARVVRVPSSTSIVVMGLTKPHAIGEYILNDCDVARLVIQSFPANAGVIYVGNASTVSATDLSLAYVIGIPAGTGPLPEYALNSTVSGGNPVPASQYWVVGTTADKFLAHFYQL